MKGVIKIEGEIGTDVTLQSVRAQIDPKATEYEIIINSGGGEVFTGEDIYNELRSLKKPKTVIITGLCASIATLIAGAGDRIKMHEVGHYMIHNPSVGIEGDARDLRKGADTLDHIKKIIISVYEKLTRKAGILKDRLWEMLDEETWFTPDEALQMGFIHEVIRDAPEQMENKSVQLKFMASIDKNRLKMKDKEKENGAVEKLMKQVANLFKIFKGFSNNLNLTLEDGTAVTVVTEDETLEGKQVTFDDGTPLSPGEYTTADGVKFMVDENSTITTVTAPDAPPAEDKDKEQKEEGKPSEEEMKQIEELKAQVETLKKELEAKNTEVKTKEEETKVANENIKKFEASLKKFEEQLTKIKNTTAGDQDAPDNDAPDKKVDDDEPEFDPMAASWGNAYMSRQQVNYN